MHYYTKLFQNPSFLMERFSSDQIIQGLGMKGIRGWQNWTIGCVMFHPDNTTTADNVIDCIHSMVGLFEHLFKRVDFEDVCFMWWDIGYGACEDRSYRHQKRAQKFTDEDGERIRQANLETILYVLNMKPLAFQKAAIHGLGHHHYPEKAQILQEYLDKHPDHPAWIREYAQAAMDGKII